MQVSLLFMNHLLWKLYLFLYSINVFFHIKALWDDNFSHKLQAD